MNELLAASGPLRSPSSPSGINWSSCTHQAPQSCPDCDGTRAELRWRPEHDRDHVLPPCMRIPNVEEAS